MKTIVLLATTAAAAMLTATAHAADTTYYDPAPQANYDSPSMGGQTFNWQGAYAGVQVGGGRMNVSGVGNDTALVGGGHAGYLMQRGNFVAGPEVDVDVTGWNVGGADVKATAHAKVRAGVAMDRVLVTGSVGYGHMWASNPGGNADNGGLSLGAGADVAITDRVIGGADYLYTDIGNVGGANVNTHTIRTRLGFKFN